MRGLAPVLVPRIVLTLMVINEQQIGVFRPHRCSAESEATGTVLLDQGIRLIRNEARVYVYASEGEARRMSGVPQGIEFQNKLMRV